MFINVFAFLHVKANSKEIVNKYLLLLFFRKMLMSAFLRFKANHLKKMRGYDHFLCGFQKSLIRSTISGWS